MNFSKYYIKQTKIDKQTNLREIHQYFHMMKLYGNNVIDIGCGNQDNLKIFFGENIKYTGLDINATRPDIIKADMHEIPEPDGKYTDALFINSLEHSISPFIALCEANRILCDKGKVHIFLPVGFGHDIDFEHIIVPTQVQIITLFHKTGFDNIHELHFGNIRTYTAEKIKSWEEAIKSDR